MKKSLALAGLFGLTHAALLQSKTAAHKDEEEDMERMLEKTLEAAIKSNEEACEVLKTFQSFKHGRTTLRESSPKKLNTEDSKEESKSRSRSRKSKSPDEDSVPQAVKDNI